MYVPAVCMIFLQACMSKITNFDPFWSLETASAQAIEIAKMLADNVQGCGVLEYQTTTQNFS